MIEELNKNTQKFSQARLVTTLIGGTAFKVIFLVSGCSVSVYKPTRSDSWLACTFTHPAIVENEAKNRSSTAPFVSTEQNGLGGNVRIMITGAAPISTPVLTFFRAAMGCSVRLRVYINAVHSLNKKEIVSEKY